MHTLRKFIQWVSDPFHCDTMPAPDKKLVVVVGAGLVGCLAATILAIRGYDGMAFMRSSVCFIICLDYLKLD
jgi:NADPH-dependent 2,4-dienoyl-CoA reductase/sulfur reductase-like enzyme